MWVDSFDPFIACKYLRISLSFFQCKCEYILGEREELLSKIEAGDGSNLAIQQLSQEINSLQARNTELQEAASKTASEHTNQVDQLRTQLKAVNTQVEDWKSQVGKLEKQKGQLTAELESRNQQVTNLQSEISSKDRIEKDLKEEIKLKFQEVEELKKNQASQLETISVLKTEITSAQTTALDKQTEIDKILESKTKLEVQITSLETDNAAYVNQIEIINVENLELKAKLEEGLKSISKLEEDLSKMKVCIF